jgi:cyclic-di-GMP phosphodiesterase TipF (flagellum assembly factor)
MVRVSAVFVAACMVLICASFGAVLYLTFGLAASEALVAAIAALTGLAFTTIAANSWRGRWASPGQIVELSRGIADLARQMVELGRRVGAVENKFAEAVERAEAATEPLSAEIGEIGVLITQLAESVSAHELALQGSGAAVPQAAASAAPAAVASLTMRPGASSTPEPRSVEPKSSELKPSEPKPSELKPLAPVVPQRREPASAPAPATISDVEMGEPAASNHSAVAGFKGLAAEAAVAVIREAIEANRLEFYLQPILTLPQRKVRFYEALARLRTADGELITAGDFLPAAEAAGLMPRIDNLMLFRCVQVVRRLMAKSRDVGLFCNISASTLVDAEFFPQFTEFMDANRAIAPALVFELTQAAYRTLGPLESESLAALMAWGFRFSLDHVADLKIEPRDLADRGFRFIKVPATLLLNRHGAGAADIHAADLTDLLSRFGIELIAEKIESEGTVVDLLDYDIKFGQGYLFSQPRPVKAEVLQSAAALDFRAPANAEERMASAQSALADPTGQGGAAGPRAADLRFETLQRPTTALAQIARVVAARAGQ